MINLDHAHKDRQQLIRSVETLPSIVAMKTEAKVVAFVVKAADALDQVARASEQITTTQQEYAVLAERKRQERRTYEARKQERSGK